MKPEFPVLHGFVHESRHTGHWETSCSFLLFLLQDVKEPLKERIVLGYIRIVQSNGFFRSRPPGGRGGGSKASETALCKPILSQGPRPSSDPERCSQVYFQAGNRRN